MAAELPHDLPAERAVISSVFLDPRVLVEIDRKLKAEHFYDVQNGMIYAAMLDCHAHRTPPDLTTVAAALMKVPDWTFDHPDTMLLLMGFADTTATAFYAEHYARQVEECATRRRLFDAQRRGARLACDLSVPVERVITESDRLLAEAADRSHLQDYAPLSDVVKQYYEYLDRLQNDPSSVIGMSTGFVDFDRMTGGLHQSDLLVLAARPGVGKSALALCIASQVATLHNAPVGVVSLEMGRDQLLQRLLSMDSGIDSQKLRNGRITSSELVTLTEALGRAETRPIHIDDTPTQSVADVQAKARRLVAAHGIRLLIIDYLQLVEGGRPGKADENRVQEVSHITRSLKQLARELDIPIIALSQLSRAVEGRQSKVPMLADLRESGSIEQDSDLVMFIYREELYDKETDKKGIAELHIAKHRNGPLGSVTLFYDQRTTRFRDLAPYSSPPGY